MRTISISSQAGEINDLLEQARHEDLLVRAADGTEFVISAVDDFDHEIARTRQNAKLMAFLDERARQTQTVSLAQVKQELGLDSSPP
jgi:hypothetical protein